MLAEFSHAREKQYLQRINSFFAKESLSSTYKPVFLKSLLDLTSYNSTGLKLAGSKWLMQGFDKLKVDLNFIAIRFIRYYWDMFFKYRLKQSHDPHDANINRIFEELKKNSSWTSKTPTMEVLTTDRYSELRRRVIDECLRREVLVHLDDQKILYERVKYRSYILIDYQTIILFKKYKQLLEPALNYVITRYLEKINLSPRIADKVAGTVNRRSLTNLEKSLLKEHGGEICFYCSGDLMGKPCFDHVVPFDYVAEDDIFNIVLACDRCNSAKSNKLVSQDLFVNKLLPRNDKLRALLVDKVEVNSSLNKRAESYSKEWYLNLYNDCKVHYHGNSPFFPA